MFAGNVLPVTVIFVTSTRIKQALTYESFIQDTAIISGNFILNGEKIMLLSVILPDWKLLSPSFSSDCHPAQLHLLQRKLERGKIEEAPKC